MHTLRRVFVLIFIVVIGIAASAQQHPNEQKGFDPDKLYSLNGIDNINTFNFNLVLTIPLGQRYQAGGGLSYGLTLVYNSKPWDAREIRGGTGGVNDAPFSGLEAIPNRRSNAGIGWLVSLGRLIPPTDETNETSYPWELGKSFVYETPDGNDVEFCCESAITASHPYALPKGKFDFKRLRLVTITERNVEFTDGTIHVFRNLSGGDSDPDWRLVEMHDRFNNTVKITYDVVRTGFNSQGPTDGSETWKIEQYDDISLGASPVRTQILRFTIHANTQHRQKTLDSIELTAFGGTTSFHTFHYRPVLLTRPSWDSSRGYGQRGGPLNAYLLESVDLPTGETYRMLYEGDVPYNATIPQGYLRSLVLPTGGSIEWTYKDVTFPAGSGIHAGHRQSELPTPPEAARETVFGVEKRTLRDAAGNDRGTWTYTRQTTHSRCDVYLPLEGGGTRSRTITSNPYTVSIVTAPDGTATANYYNTWINAYPENCDTLHEGWDEGEYGLPFTRHVADHGKFLSTEIFTAISDPQIIWPSAIGDKPRVTGALQQSSFVQYEHFGSDALGVAGSGGFTEIARRTVNEKGCGGSRETHDKGKDACFTEVRSSQFDGFGHFLQQSMSSSPDFGPDRFKTTFTHFTPQANEWLLDLYDEQCTYEGSVDETDTVVQNCAALPNPMTQQFCFNLTTGFLNRVRTVKNGASGGTDDLVVDYTSGTSAGAFARANGNIATESHYGGDDHGAPLGCNAATSSPNYKIFHTYDLGVRKTSKYAGTNFFFLDLDLDHNTGLATVSRDTAGTATRFTYDVAGRLTEVVADGIAPMKYAYTLARTNPFAGVHVEMNQKAAQANVDGERLTTWDFDWLGRPVKQQTKNADDSFSVTDTVYDALGRRISTTTPYKEGESPKGFAQFQYDVFNRVTKATAPDLTVAETEYRGERFRIRKSQVGMNPWPAPPANVETEETYDAQGRLVEVVEPAGPHGEDLTATYQYDAANRLIDVKLAGVEGSQRPRRFFYDHRGFLQLEQHPEKTADVTYGEYDARGHAHHRVDASPDFDLHYEFDSAERLTTVRKTNGNVIKEFVFGDDAGTRGLGKLVKARRHNYIDGNDYVVEENYDYEEPGGRISKKTTNVLLNDTTTVRSFRQDYTYSLFGGVLTTTYPHCDGCTALPARTVENIFHNGYLVGVGKWADKKDAGDRQVGITYHPNGLVATIVHSAKGETIDRFGDDPNGMARPSEISFDGFCEGPAINAAEPADATIASGTPTTLAITPPADGQTHTYQWYRRPASGADLLIAGATASSFTTPQLTETAKYYVVVTGPSCNSSSRVATVTVPPCSGLTITTQPRDAIIATGTTALLAVAVSAPGFTPQFTWYEGERGDTSHPTGGTAETFTTPALSDTKKYWVRVSGNGCSADSITVSVTVCHGPVILQQPRSVFVADPPAGEHSPAIATIVAEGGDKLRYQWFKAGESTPISGQNTATLSLSFEHGELTTAHEYYALVSWSNAASLPGVCTTRSDVFVIGPKSCSRILAQPPSMAVFENGQVIDLKVVVEGGTGVTYQWYHGLGRDRILLPGGNTDTVQVTVAEPDAYWCEITDSCGTITTDRAYLNLQGTCPLPALEVLPAAAIVDIGKDATFTAVCDWPGVTYQWYRGQTGDTSSPVEGATLPGLTVGSIVSSYWVRVTDPCGKSYVDSAPVALSVNLNGSVCSPPRIVVQPKSIDIAAGAPAALDIDVRSDSTVQIDWFALIDGVPVFAGGGAHVTVTPAVSTTYYARVHTDCAGIDTNSLPATVRVASCNGVTVSRQPVRTLIKRGSFADLSVAASAASGVSCQWYEGMPGDRSRPVAGGTLQTLHVTPVETTTYYAHLTTSQCAIDSDPAEVRVCIPPSITAQPSNIDIVQGQRTLLGIGVEGTDVFVEWFSGTPQAPGARVASSQYTYVYPAYPTTYFAKVSTPCETMVSNVITVNVCSDPHISRQPESAWVFSGQRATLSVGATGGNGVPLTYLWTATGGGPAGPDNTAATFTTPPLTAPQNFRVNVTAGHCTVTSDTVTVNICTLPEVVTFAKTYSTAANQPVHLSIDPYSPVAATMYTWYEGEPGDVAHSIIVRGENASDSFDVVPTKPSTRYWAQVRRGACKSHTPAHTVLICIPTIVTPPQNGLVLSPDAPVTLVVDAADATGYQWYLGESGDTAHPIAEGNRSSIDVAPSVDTHYWVRVTGECNVSVDSDTITVRSCQNAAITQGPQSRFITQGTTITLAVVATGTDLTYEWYRGPAGDVSNKFATTASVDVTPLDTTSYWVRVKAPCGPVVDSPVALITVCAAPQITAQPLSQKIFRGTAATLSVTATEATSELLHYQWSSRSGTEPWLDISNSDLPALNTGALTSPADYRVKVRAATCEVLSNVATVSLCTYPEVVALLDRNVGYGDPVTLSLNTITPALDKTITWYGGTYPDRSNPQGSGLNRVLSITATATAQYWAEFQYDGCLSHTNTVTVRVCLPAITSQPSGTVIASGNTATLSAGTTTISGQSFQWYLGNSGVTANPIAGATSATFTTPNLTATKTYWMRVTGPCGTADTNAATVTVCASPVITGSSPAVSSIRSGDPVLLNVSAAGSNLTYQWYIGPAGNTSNPYAGATANNITVSPAANTSYWVRITSDGVCTTDSITMTVDVCTNPSITTQPASPKIREGQTAVLSVATSASPVTYQWYQGASGTTTSPVAGATAATWTTPALSSDTNYWVRITRGACTVNSVTAAVIVCKLTASASNVNIASGQSATLTVTPNFTRNTPTYTWYRGNLGDTTVPSGSAQSLTTPALTQNTNYWVRVNDGTCTYDAGPYTVFVCVPTITTAPQSVIINNGQTTTLTVAATGSPITYQWYRGSSGDVSQPVSGATGTSYMTPPLSTTTNYWVRVTGCGAADSPTATVTVCVPPAAPAPTASPAANIGNTVYVEVNATGTGTLAYQWYRGATSGDTSQPISGATAAHYDFTAGQTAFYWVRITGMCGTFNSAAVEQDVRPSITTQPQSQSIPSGATATLSVVASGTYLTYQWYRGAAGDATNPVTGATAATFTTPALTTATTYWCRVASGATGVVSSSAATISMCSGPTFQTSQQWLSGNCYRLFVTVSQSWVGNVAYTWYRGTPGNTAQSTLVSEGGPTGYYISVCVTEPTTYWCRVWKADHTCYRDSGGFLVNPIE